MTFSKVAPNVRQQCRHRNSTGRAAQSAATAHPAANIVLCPRARASPNRTDHHLHIFHRINVQVTGQRHLSAGSPTHDDNDFDRLTIVSCSGSQPSLNRRTLIWGLHGGLCTPWVLGGSQYQLEKKSTQTQKAIAKSSGKLPTTINTTPEYLDTVVCLFLTNQKPAPTTGRQENVMDPTISAIVTRNP